MRRPRKGLQIRIKLLVFFIVWQNRRVNGAGWGEDKNHSVIVLGCLRPSAGRRRRYQLLMDQPDKLDTARAVQLALEAGFDLAGIAPAGPLPEAAHFIEWSEAGLAGELRYLTGHRAEIRLDPRRLLPAARSVLCVAKLYHGPEPLSVESVDDARGWISRYAWGEDYHDVLRGDLKRLVKRLEAANGRPFDHRLAIDTAPFLDVAHARHAGLGWIGKNTCLARPRRTPARPLRRLHRLH